MRFTPDAYAAKALTMDDAAYFSALGLENTSRDQSEQDERAQAKQL
jgi:hypothetical protein